MGDAYHTGLIKAGGLLVQAHTGRCSKFDAVEFFQGKFGFYQDAAGSGGDGDRCSPVKPTLLIRFIEDRPSLLELDIGTRV